MKIMVVGGISTRNAAKAEKDELKSISLKLGEAIVKHGDDLAACSPFDDSVDFHAVSAAVQTIKANDLKVGIEMHYPDDKGIAGAVKNISGFDHNLIRRLPHPALDDMQYSWLFSQLKALDTANGVVALGGKLEGSAELLLEFANVRGKAILPLNYLGGAATHFYAKNQWRIADDLEEKFECLSDASMVDQVPALLNKLITGQGTTRQEKFFISYSRSRPAEADYIEILLKRRNLSVFRDEQDFEPSADVQNEIFKNIRKADVFIAVWCKEYACSPWCFDELDYALECKEKSDLDIWLFVTDDTRVVPPKARNLVYYRVSSRADIEGFVLNLLGRADSTAD